MLSLRTIGLLGVAAGFISQRAVERVAPGATSNKATAPLASPSPSPGDRPQDRGMTMTSPGAPGPMMVLSPLPGAPPDGVPPLPG